MSVILPVLLDTDILSEFLRGNPKVVENANEYLQEYDNLNVSIITYYEILNGLLYKDAKKQLSKFEHFISLNNVLYLTLKSAQISATIFASLRKKGIQIGHTDTLIAGIALANDLQLVTNNTNHFTHIPGLIILNWSK